MNKSIHNPIFIIGDDLSVYFVHDAEDIDYGEFEPIDVADGVYSAFDSEGQILKLVTVNDENRKIERPTESKFKIPYFGQMSIVSLDRSIKAISTGIKDELKLRDFLTKDLIRSGYQAEGLELKGLVSIYQENNKKLYDKNEERE